MATPRKVVLVASASSADRAIVLARLLEMAAGRSGWSERLEIRLGGLDGGAGRPSDAGLDAMKEAGIEAAGAVCPDLERRRDLARGAAVVVCDRGDAADILVDWDESGEAGFVCVDEVLGSEDDEDRDEVPIAEDLRLYRDAIDEILRRVITSGEGD